MKLILPALWAAKYFAEGSAPAEVTIIRWLRSGKLAGRKVGGAWYIDEHAWLANGDELVQRVLDRG